MQRITKKIYVHSELNWKLIFVQKLAAFDRRYRTWVAADDPRSLPKWDGPKREIPMEHAAFVKKGVFVTCISVYIISPQL
jgi:hypothetical protein